MGQTQEGIYIQITCYSSIIINVNVGHVALETSYTTVLKFSHLLYLTVIARNHCEISTGPRTNARGNLVGPVNNLVNF